MEQLTPEVYCRRAALELALLIRHQRRPKARARHESALLRRIVSDVLSSAPGPDQLQDGPWRVGQRPLKKPGRRGLKFIPLVQRGNTTIMVSTPEEAEELVAFLNYCRMEDLTVPNG